MAVVGMFAHHNRIIHNNPQSDDQSKKRNHIQGDPNGIHQRNCGQHRHGDARCHPKSGAGIEKQKQQAKNQRQTCRAIGQQNF